MFIVVHRRELLDLEQVALKWLKNGGIALVCMMVPKQRVVDLFLLVLGVLEENVKAACMFVGFVDFQVGFLSVLVESFCHDHAGCLLL